MVESYKECKLVKKMAKRVVSEAKGQAFKALCTGLLKKKGEKGIYRLAKIRQRSTEDLEAVKRMTERLENCYGDACGRAVCQRDMFRLSWICTRVA